MSGRIYFIQVGSAGPIKIGFTRATPADRMYELQCGCPWLLRLLGSVAGTKCNEDWLQQKFAPSRMSGEWFDASIAADIQPILAPDFSWPKRADLNPIDRAIQLAGSQCNLSNAIGCDQPTISLARRTGKLPKRIQEYLSAHESVA